MNALNSYDELSARGMERSGRGCFLLCTEAIWNTWRCGCLHFVVHKRRISCYTNADMSQHPVPSSFHNDPGRHHYELSDLSSATETPLEGILRKDPQHSG